VLLLPIDDDGRQGLLAIRRGIEPRRGQLALPGGFIDLNETWQEAAARELFEETGIRLDPTGVREFQVRSARDGTLLIFALAPAMRASNLPPFEPTNETSERVVLREPIELAFGLHTEAARTWFERRASGQSP
jgi:ADP-ribose pyrophosphatase YjhB (NUDIX family)